MGGKTVRVSGFSMNVTANGVKNFLEKYTGHGSVIALEVRHTGAHTYAIVQFLTTEEAELVCNKAEALQVKVGYEERDIVPKPPMFVLEDIILQFGCLISENKLGVLWECKAVKARFGFNMKKIWFFLSHGSRSYKLDLSYESIWEIKLHLPPHGRSEFLVIQVKAAPRIYEMVPIHGNPRLNYFKDVQDNQWMRTTDFSPRCSIGQSFALCLQLPYNCSLPDFNEYFSSYQRIVDHLELEAIRSYSQSLDLVPIVKPHRRIVVPYRILFKVNHMVQNGTLVGPTLDDEFFSSVRADNFPVDYIEHALEKMSHSRSFILNLAKWLNDQCLKYRNSNIQLPSPAISDAGMVYIRSVQITPSKVYFYGPEIIISNHVIRQYSEDLDNFIRISFVDEDSGKRMFSTDLAPHSFHEKHTKIYKRVLDVLRNGIVIGDKKLIEFLAFSSSQLRESSTWMFASREGLTAFDIRKRMGNFSMIRNVAKYAARLGQSFSSSTETLTVSRHEVEIIQDIHNHKGYLFSDGIGKISSEFARSVAIKCGLKSSTPSAFQIRYGGYKGVVAVDPTSSWKLSLRKSMRKFESENNKLDVLAYSKYHPCFLNHELITLLSTLGVQDHVFEEKQKKVVDQLDELLTNPSRALEAIELMYHGETTNIIKEMLLCGYKPNAEPFLSMLLQTFRATKLFELRTKSRIFVPEGRSMIGCLDETRTLKYGQVFVQVSCNGSESGVVLTRRVIVAKSPCLHPGDVRSLIAIDVPALHHMVDCVVFPQQGKRPHPNECSGSDLDGDIYFVSWDPALIPPREVAPMEYTAAPAETLHHAVTIEVTLFESSPYLEGMLILFCSWFLSMFYIIPVLQDNSD